MSDNNTNNEKILIITDDLQGGAYLQKILGAAGYDHVDLSHYLQNDYSLILIDTPLNEEAGFNLLEKITRSSPETPVIVVVDFNAIDAAVLAMKRGAFGFLEKPVHTEKMVLMVKRALEHYFLRHELIRLTPHPETTAPYHGLIGESEGMKRIIDLIERIRASDVPVLITGPSGSGKEMVARAIHQTSLRAAQKFVAINCSAIPETLLEGELFGYKKGAFTDARTDKIGLFQEADGGTIFLDEIGDMSLSLQPKILRVLQEKEIRPLGALQTAKIDVRVIAATNQDLKKKIENKLFRDDLFYRLNVINIIMPALKERLKDLPLLIDHFLNGIRQKLPRPIRGVSKPAMKCLLEYGWPGNIRELQNVIERAALLSEGEYIMPEDFPFFASLVNLSEEAKKGRPLAEVEKDYILEVLREMEGNRSRAAEVLGIGRKTLYNKLERYRPS